MRVLKEGDEALVLLPTDHNKLLLKWQGPLSVVKRTRVCDYVVKLSSGSEKVLHINMLKKYTRRTDTDVDVVSVGVLMGSSILPDEDVDNVEVQLLPTGQTETVNDVCSNGMLSVHRKDELSGVFGKYKDKMTDLPGNVSGVEHSARVSSDKVVNLKPYPLPFESERAAQEEVRKMLELNVTELSSSPYSSPIVLVKKKDGSTRFCTDFCALNGITVFDAEPIPDPEQLYASLKDDLAH